MNQARLDEGLAPYRFSTLLTAAAQQHADDLAEHQIWSHTGSDGSTPSERIEKAGFLAWKWNSGESIVGENFWTGYGTPEDAMAFFLEDPPHRDNILSVTHREIGIGVAADAEGRNYFVLDFGARPNVLPIFTNEGATSTDDPQVAILLTNEEARPEGEGAIFMGKAIEIRISNDPGFDDQPWQRWESLVPWTLPDTPGEHTVYVQFRDAAGRTAASADSIFLGEGASIAPTPIPPTSTPEPTATPETAAPPVSDLTTTPTSEPLPTLPPSPTMAPTAPSHTPVSTPTSPSVALSVTPFPTWTPLPTAAPPVETSGPDAPLITLLALQAIAIILGIYLALHRRPDEHSRTPDLSPWETDKDESLRFPFHSDE